MTSELALFRQEVLDFQQDTRRWGNVVLLEPLYMKVIVWLLIVIATGIIIFLCFAQYARKETVIGYLTPETGTAKIFPTQHGTIKSVHITEGQLVHKGQPLLTIETTHIAESGQDTNASILRTLTRQRAALTQQILAEELRTNSEQERLKALIRSNETEVDHLRTQIKIQTERMKISQSFVASASQLNSKGYIADIELKRRQHDVLEQEQSLNALNQQMEARQSQLMQNRYALEQLPTVMADKAQLLRNELVETELRISEANVRRAYVISAPAAGRVSMLQATQGQIADPRHLQVEIVPSQSALQAELFIPTRAAGLIQPGQSVRILYHAFPYQRYGTYSGRIVRLSETVLTGSEISAPVEIKEASYKAVVALDRPDIGADGKRIPLQPDMLLTADIIIEKRSIMSWFMDPFVGAGRSIEVARLGDIWSEWIIHPVREAAEAIEAQLVRLHRLVDHLMSTKQQRAREA